MALDKEDIKALVEALRAPDARVAAEHDARLKKHAAKRAKLKADTKKDDSHAYYRVTQQSYINGVGLVEPGGIVALPHVPVLDEAGEPVLDSKGKPKLQLAEPSHTWEKVLTAKELRDAREAEVEAEAKANDLANEDFDGKGKPGAVKGKPGKRASDTDVA